jgi:hypothetical protein
MRGITGRRDRLQSPAVNRKAVRAAVAGAVAVALAAIGIVAILPASADTAPRRIVNAR